MNPFNPENHHRRSIRLKGYDYSQAGLYYITICTYNREPLFGEIKNGKMIMNDAGRMVETIWNKIPTHFPHAKLHEFVVMPNHVHGIIEIGVTKWFRENTDVQMVWHRDYYEHIIRDAESYRRICVYILNNPIHWQEDKYCA